MPSFDIVSKVDLHELSNAVDQANREITNRFDFKDIDAKYELSGSEIKLSAPSDFQVKQMQEILKTKLAKRNVDVQSLDYQDINAQLHQATQVINVRQGIDSKTAKDIVKLIKGKKMKVQAAIQGEQVRVTGKKRDDLQEVIGMLREQDLDLPLQYENFRD